MPEICKKRELKKYVNEHDVVVVKFYAPWCSACKKIEPAFLKYKTNYKKVNFAKVNIDKCKSLGDYYKIKSFPTFLFFVDGELQRDLTFSGSDRRSLKKNIKYCEEKYRKNN